MHDAYRNEPATPVQTTPNRSQSVHRATMRPYEVMGKTYYPTMVRVGDIQQGVASWYGSDFHGKRTSNGEVYNMYAMTAAHKTMPMNTMLRVLNTDSGQSAVVRINDRGPFVKSRIIDLSFSAAKRLGIDRRGTAPVRIEVIGFDGTIPSGNVKASGAGERVVADFGVQIGSFRRLAGAQTYQKRFDRFEGRYRTVIKTFQVDGAPLHRVWLVGFRSQEEARDFIAAWNFPGAFVISYQESA